jgi:tetratricopeptide (TPR) repeat protein
MRGAFETISGGLEFDSVEKTVVSQTLGTLTDPTDTTIGRYQLLQQIGEGGFGVVFMAEQQEPVKRKVALKIIKAGMDTREIIARFEAERQALALMDHPNIAQVLDGGAATNGRPYFVMELVRGIPITQYCDKANLSTHERLELFIKVCRAIQHAHQKGVIHRDLKPGNVLVTLHDGESVPKVIDFGVAKALGQKLTERTPFTRLEQMIGTPAYMSPEQAGLRGLDIDTRSDIYSLGVLLYELLTGVTPIDAEALQRGALEEIRRMIQEIDPPKPSTRLLTLGERLIEVARHRRAEPAALSRLIRGDLDWIVMKALEKDRNRRYETANGLALDVQRYLGDEAVFARPPSAGYRLQKFVRKHRTAVAVTTGFALLLTAATVVSGLLALRANREGTRASKSEIEARATLGFFRDKVLAAGRPKGEAGGLGYDVTLKAAINAAESNIASSFANAPLVEASIRNAMGDSYRYLGEYSNAVRQYERALALRSFHLGREKPETIQTMYGLAAGYHNVGHRNEAFRLLEEILRTSKGKFGPDHPQTLAAMHGMAIVYDDAGRKNEALQLFEQTLKLRKAKLGLEHPDTLRSSAALAGAYLDARRDDEAIRLMEETFRLSRAKLGPDHPDSLSCMNYLASAYFTVGRYSEALPLFEATQKLHNSQLGPDHPDTTRTLYTFASALHFEGRLEEAIPLYEESLKLSTSKLGSAHVAVIELMWRLACAYNQSGRLDHALILSEEALNLMWSTLGPNHPETLHVMSLVAQAYEQVDRPADASSLFEELLKLQRDKLAPDHPDTIDSMNRLAHAYCRSGRQEQALPILENALKTSEAKLGADHPDTLTAMGNLAALYFSMGRPIDALPVFEKSLRLTKAKAESDYSYAVHTMNTLASAYRASGRLGEAIALYEEIFALKRSELGASHSDTVVAMGDLALAYLEGQRFKEASGLYEKVLEHCEARNGPNNSSTVTAMNNLAWAYKGAGRLDEALFLFKQTLSRTSGDLNDLGRVTFMSSLALTYRDLQKFADAEILYRDLLAHHRKNSGADSTELASTLGSLGECLLRQDEYAQAEPLLRESLAVFEVKLPDSWKTSQIQSRLGMAMLGQGRFAEAEPLLVRSYDALTAQEQQIPALSRNIVKDTGDRLVQLYEAWGRSDRAAEWRKRLPESTPPENITPNPLKP